MHMSSVIAIGTIPAAGVMMLLIAGITGGKDDELLCFHTQADECCGDEEGRDRGGRYIGQ